MVFWPLIGNGFDCEIGLCVDDVHEISTLTPKWEIFEKSLKCICFDNVLFDEVREISDKKKIKLTI